MLLILHHKIITEKTPDEETVRIAIQVGDNVRVKASVVSPTHGWGSVTHASVGVVTEVKDDGSMEIDFPEQSYWSGRIEEMEIVEDGEAGLETPGRL